VLERIGDVGAHPVGGGSVGRAHHEHRREHPKAGIEQRVPRVQVAADHIGQVAARPVADHRHLPPGRHLQEGGYRDEAGVLYAAHAVLVAVRKHDDVATPRPVLVTVINGNPAGAAGDDVEQDDTVGVWPEDLRCLPRGQRLIRPRLAVLSPEEYRSFQPQPLKRRLERRRRPALVTRGHVIRCAGVAVMVKRRTPHETDRVMNIRRPPQWPGKDKRWPYLWTSTWMIQGRAETGY